MHKKTEHISICIASYKRPQLLATLLASLKAQHLPAHIVVSIIVVDNDPKQTARDTVEDAKANGLPISYYVQPEKNIALTRNMSVLYASGDYIAFIDDDECATEDWLKSLYETLITYKADVVFGPVVGVLPSDAPAWITEGNFFQRPRYSTGTVSPIRGTGNVLLRADILADRVAPFNAKYGLIGGEDTDLFKRLEESGKKFIWCDEAVVMEEVLPDRLNVRWLISRAFRGGQVFAEIYVTPKKAIKKPAWFIYRLSLALLACIVGVFAWPLRKAWGVMCFQKVASNLGQLSSLFKPRYKEYI